MQDLHGLSILCRNSARELHGLRKLWRRSVQDMFGLWKVWRGFARDMFGPWTVWRKSARELHGLRKLWRRSARDAFGPWTVWRRSARDAFGPWTVWRKSARDAFGHWTVRRKSAREMFGGGIAPRSRPLRVFLPLSNTTTRCPGIRLSPGLCACRFRIERRNPCAPNWSCDGAERGEQLPKVRFHLCERVWPSGGSLPDVGRAISSAISHRSGSKLPEADCGCGAVIRQRLWQLS